MSKSLSKDYYSKINVEDLFICNRVKTRKEMISSNVLNKNQMEVSGGYLNLLKHFNLNPPRYYDKYRDDYLEKIKELTEIYLSTRGKYPSNKDIENHLGIKFQFIRYLGGTKEMFHLLGFSDYMNNKDGNLLEQIGRHRIVEEFLQKFDDKDSPPTMRVVNELHKNKEFIISGYSIAKYFGSFESFLIENFYVPNFKGISKRGYAIDGHLCDSSSEIVIDNFLHRNGIKNKVHVP